MAGLPAMYLCHYVCLCILEEVMTGRYGLLNESIVWAAFTQAHGTVDACTISGNGENGILLRGVADLQDPKIV